MIFVTETRSGPEAKRLNRYLMLRDRKLIYSTAMLLILAISGILLLLFGSPLAFNFYVFYIIGISLALIYINFYQFFNLNAYGLSNYPLTFEFDEEVICVSSATGIKCSFLWKSVRNIKIGKNYINLYTDVGIYRIKLSSLGDRQLEIIAMWNRGKRGKLPK